MVRSGRLARTVALVVATVWASALQTLVALAQPYPGGGQTPPTVRGERFFQGQEGTARTGQDLLLLLFIALGALMLGFILRRLNSRTAGSDD